MMSVIKYVWNKVCNKVCYITSSKSGLKYKTGLLKGNTVRWKKAIMQEYQTKRAILQGIDTSGMRSNKFLITNTVSLIKRARVQQQ